MATRHTPPSLRPTVPAWAKMSSPRLDHVIRVAELVACWADEMGIPENERARWLRAVWLHDALREVVALAEAGIADRSARHRARGFLRRPQH